MANAICMGAMMKCSFGAAPSSLVVLPTSRVLSGQPTATIMDNKPMLNIPPFGVCMSMANPMVAAATAAAFGVLTPMPCIPATVSPWVVGAPTVMIGSLPALNSTAKLMCMWAGVIQLLPPGVPTVQTP